MQPGRKIKKLPVYLAQAAGDSDGISAMGGEPFSISNIPEKAGRANPIDEV